MTSESLTWKLEQDLCRCCHSEGSFCSLSDTEIYSDMLRNLDVHISPVEGPLCMATYTICQECIEQLVAANNFKKQALSCEERFKEMYSKNFIQVYNPTTEVKEEEPEEIQDVFKDEFFPPVDDDDDDEDPDHDDYHTDFDRNDEPVLPPPKKQKKPKPKPKTKKKKVKKTKKVAATLDGDSTDVIAKKGGKFTLTEEDYTKIGDIYHCARCEKTYDKVDSLRFHVKIKHYKIPRYHCPYCTKEFMTPAPLTVHKLEVHDKDERFKCNACKCMFNTKVQLKKHINNFHMMGEKFRCEYCEYESFSFESMYKHKFKHKTVKDYHCRFCKKSFLRKTTLDLHERIHTGDRRKVCSVCGTAFVQKASLNYHMTKYHPEVNY